MLRVDKYGLVTAGTDGGDACHRTYAVLLLCRLLYLNNLGKGESYENAITKVTPRNVSERLQVSPGIYIRHPDPGWTSGIYTCSRDQLTPVICFLAVMANSPTPGIAKYYRKELSNLLIQCLKRGMFAQNKFHNGDDPNTAKAKVPDFIGPELWAVFASGYVKTLWAPLAIVIMIFGDIVNILGALISVYAPINKDGTLKFRWPMADDVDDMNPNNIHLSRMSFFSTPFSWIARKIYMLRRQNLGNTVFGETSSVMGALAYYNQAYNHDITELYRPLVGKY